MLKTLTLFLVLLFTFCLVGETSYYDYSGKKVTLKQDFSLAAVNGDVSIDTKILPGRQVIYSVNSFKGNLSVNRLPGIKDRKDWSFLSAKLNRLNSSIWPVVVDNAGNKLVLDGTVGVKFKEHLSEKSKSEILKSLSLKIVEMDMQDPDFVMVSVEEGQCPFFAARTLFEKGYVRWAQPNWFQKYVTKAAPNDTYYDNQWHLDQIYAEQAWDFETGDSSVKIAIVDSGVDTDHPDLVVTTGYDYLDNDSNPNPDIANDDHYGVPHGTSVAGIAASKTDNNLGVAGVCQNCTIIPIRLIGGYISSFDIRNALRYAVDQGAWVVNNSWGPQNSSCHNVSANSYQASAVEYGKTDGRGGKGTIMVWAAGNDSCDTDTDGDLKNDDIVVVSALTSYGSFASYSNYGDEVDVSAGAASYTTDIAGSYGYNYLSGSSDGDSLSNLDYTSVFAGTSAAAPVVSGAIALMLAANPDLTFSGALNCLKSTARKVTKYCSKGDWELQSDIYLEAGSKEHSPCFGFGKVDVNLMVQGAINETCGACVKTADVDLCYSDGAGVDDDCEGGIDDNCSAGGDGKAGDACTGDSLCANTGNDYFCKTEWQDGYCSGNCDSDGDCFGSGLSKCVENECRATCVSSAGLRDGYKCEEGIVIPGIPDPEPYCGDGVVEGDEECDDGNRESGDGCSFACTKEPECTPDEMECRYTALFWCNGGFWEIVRDCADEGKVCETNAFTSYCEVPGVCGNSSTETGEECDDGNTVTEKCDYGETECNVCASNCTIQAGVTEFCGDNVKNGSEECDDGNTADNDGCDSACKIEVVFECTPDNMECRGTDIYWCNAGSWSFVKDCDPLGQICEQNGIYAVCKTEEIPDEGPDDGPDETPDIIPDDGPDDIVPDEINDESVDEVPDETSDDEVPDTSDDDVVSVDDVITDTDGETTDEEIVPGCGNDVLEDGEECDDGNNVPGDGCDPTCKEEIPPECGNGVLEYGEECDDGNNVPGDGCDPLCKEESEAVDDEINDENQTVDENETPDESQTSDKTTETQDESNDNGGNEPEKKNSSGCSMTLL